MGKLILFLILVFYKLYATHRLNKETLVAVITGLVYPSSAYQCIERFQLSTMLISIIIKVVTSAPLKLRRYGAVQICLLLLFLNLGRSSRGGRHNATVWNMYS